MGCTRFPLALLLTVGCASGCYGAAHEPPARPQAPALTPGATASVERARHKAFLDSTGSYHDGSTSLTFRYGDQRLSYSQYRALVDPRWSATLDEYDELVKRCQRANIPKYIGYAAIVGGFAFGIWGNQIVGDNEQAQAAGFYGGVGLGVAAYAAGYLLFGGRACNEAGRMWDGENPWLEYADDDHVPDFNDTREELDRLTADFNARVGAGKPARAAAPND